MKSVEIVLKKKQIIKYVLDKYKFQNYDTSNIGYDELSDNWDDFGKKYILGKNICKNKQLTKKENDYGRTNSI